MIPRFLHLFSTVEVSESWINRNNFTMKLAGKLGNVDVSGDASIWAGDIELNNGKQLVSFCEDDYEGQPAVVENTTGNGTTVYVAAIGLDDNFLDNLCDYVMGKAGVKFTKGIPEHVEVIHRGKYTFAINHLKEDVKLEFDGGCKAILGEVNNGEADLGPYGVAIFERVSE